jgi:cystathionine beta-lyase/cystathionine gamma-synthase
MRLGSGVRDGKDSIDHKNYTKGDDCVDFFTKTVSELPVQSPDNAVSPPIYQTSAYSFSDIDDVDAILGGKRLGYSYTRGGNPNTDTLGQLVAKLENAEAGIVTASGTAALMSAILTLLPSPGRIMVAREIYGGTVGIVRNILGPLGYRMEWADTHDLQGLEEILAQHPGLFVLESISNPLGRVCALDQVIALAHDYQTPVIVDNTFATPFHATPLQWDADLVVHSLTKFIGGHSDVTLGAVAGSGTLVRKVTHLVDSAGFTPDPFAAWLAFRGAKTLALRMQQGSGNALKLASFLEQAPGIRRVYYPGLSSHPDHIQAQRLLRRGYGCIVSASLEGGYSSVQQLIRHLNLVKFVPSLGDVSTTISHPVVASHRELTPEEKAQVGIDDTIVRISVGIESSEDIIADFSQALTKISE